MSRFGSSSSFWLEVPPGLVVGVEVVDPKAPASVTDVLARSMARPLVGRPRRPARIRVADAALADALRAVVPDADVVVGPTPELDAVVADMVAAMPPGDERESYLEAGRVPADAVAKLFRAAEMLYRLAPWKTARDDRVVRVDIPALGVHGACLSVIGALGESLGFVLFPSRAGYEAFLAAADRRFGDRLDLGTTTLSLTFAAGADIAPGRRREIAAHGWPVAGPRAYPVVEHRDPDGLPRPLTDARRARRRRARPDARDVHRAAPAGARRRPLSPGVRDLRRRDGPGGPPHGPVRGARRVRGRGASARREGVTQRPLPLRQRPEVQAVLRQRRRGGGARPCPGRAAVLDMMDYGQRRFAVTRAGEGFRDPGRTLTLFVPWAVYGFRVDGRPLVAWYLEERGRRLSARERDWLGAQQRAWLSVWEVLAVDPGAAVTVRDLLSGEERRVREVSGSRGLAPRDALLARVVDHAGESLFCGVHPRPLPPAAAGVVLRVRAALRAKGGVPVERLRDDGVGRRLIACWEEAVADLDRARAVPPDLRNTDGDPLLLTVDHFAFAPADRPAVEARLGAMEGVEPPEADEPERAFTFLRAGTHAHERTVVGRVVVTDRALRVETNSIRRADTLRRRIEDACGERVRHRAREHADPTSPQVRAAHRGVPTLPLESPEAAAALRAVKERHYADWLDHPLPALGGRTPREAARTKAGRAQVDVPLKEIENHEARLPDGARFHVGGLRAELGLDG